LQNEYLNATDDTMKALQNQKKCDRNDTRRSYSRYPILREAGWLATVVSLAHIGVVGTGDLAGGL